MISRLAILKHQQFIRIARMKCQHRSKIRFHVAEFPEKCASNLQALHAPSPVWPEWTSVRDTVALKC